MQGIGTSPLALGCVGRSATSGSCASAADAGGRQRLHHACRIVRRAWVARGPHDRKASSAPASAGSRPAVRPTPGVLPLIRPANVLARLAWRWPPARGRTGRQRGRNPLGTGPPPW